MSRIIVVIALVTIVAGAPAVRAAAVGPDDLVREGIALLKAGKYEEALVKFKNAQIDDPTSPQIHFDIGLCHYKLERWTEAEQAFTNALFAQDIEIEKRAALYLGNCAVKQGKYKQALEWYNRALETAPDYEDAKVNRAWVVRKLKELARKKKEQEEKQKQQRRIIEKLQEIIKRETAAHALVRTVLLSRGSTLPPTPLKELAPLLDGVQKNEEIAAADEAKLGDLLAGTGKDAAEILEMTKALLAEIDERLAQTPPAPQGAAPQGQGPMPQDPEIPKLKSARPHVEAAIPFLEQALTAATEDESWTGLHAAQQEALVRLLKALDALLDELSRLIRDQASLLQDTTALSDATEASENAGGEQALAPEDPTDRAREFAKLQRQIKQRTEAFARGVEQQLRMQQQAAQQPKGQSPSPTPGAEPDDVQERMKKALEHLNAAGEEMDGAASDLDSAALKPATEKERKALEELVRARAALSPPKQGGNQGEKKEQQKGDDQSDAQKNEQKKKGESGEQQNRPDEQQGRKEQQDSEAGKKGEQEQRPISKEQARKMLERARQREKDLRRRNKDERRRRVTSGRARGKDW